MQETTLGGRGQTIEGVGNAIELVAFGFGLQTALEVAILDGPESTHTPVGGNPLLDDAQLDIVGGLEAVNETIENLVEKLTGFAG